MKNEKSISLFYLIMVSSAFVVSIRNLPTIAETQMQMIFLGIVAALVFFIPGALVSAELATGWPDMGGVAVWVKEAFGKRLGLLASWFQWTYMVISAIAMLYFISSSIAYMFKPDLADNWIYLLVSELVLIWLFTFLNLKGLSISKLISTIGFLAGVLLPAFLIIVLGLIYIFQGNEIQLDLSLTRKNLIPNFEDLSTIVLFVGFMRAFAGIEASAAHANNVENPQKNYPIAIMIVVIFGLVVNILGSMAVAVVVPQKEISLVSGVMVAFSSFLKTFNLSFLLPLLGLLAAVGQTGGFSTWITGPVKGLLKYANEGELPAFFKKVNKHEVPVNLMIIQAIIISVLGSFFLLFTESINIAFWISVALSMLIYVSMYFLMFLSGLYLRYKKPNVERKFKIPFKNYGMWFVASLGMIGMVLSFVIAFIPPSQLPQSHHDLYYSVLILGVIIIYISPFAIESFKKRSQRK
ncbi:MAG: amino acid permease [Parachlamydiales bacterium]|jgi:amino acid transporter